MTDAWSSLSQPLTIHLLHDFLVSEVRKGNLEFPVYNYKLTLLSIYLTKKLN